MTVLRSKSGFGFSRTFRLSLHKGRQCDEDSSSTFDEVWQRLATD
jgi:hypothetical protein